jgi:hypothetical protein
MQERRNVCRLGNAKLLFSALQTSGEGGRAGLPGAFLGFWSCADGFDFKLLAKTIGLPFQGVQKIWPMQRNSSTFDLLKLAWEAESKLRAALPW